MAFENIKTNPFDTKVMTARKSTPTSDSFSLATFDKQAVGFVISRITSDAPSFHSERHRLHPTPPKSLTQP
jgi:hypothetical protein